MNKQWYEKEIEGKQKEAGATAAFVNRKNDQSSHDFDNYERLCRGEQTRVRTRTHRTVPVA